MARFIRRSYRLEIKIEWIPAFAHGRQLNEAGTPFQYSAHHFCHSVRRIPVGESVVKRISGIHSEQIQFPCMDSVQI
jgi:hypothetical protein